MALPNLQDAFECLQQDDVEGAIATLQRKVEELPAHLTAHVLLARAYESNGQLDRALSCWEEAYFLMPNSPVVREGKRRVLRRMDREREAADIEEVAPTPPPSASTPTEDEPTDEPSADAPADEDAPTTASEAVSELDELRRQAEEEARQGGARPDLDDTSASAPEAFASETPEERVDQIEEEDDDLDRLIDELESARIEPSPDVEDVPEPDLESDADDLVSETLARIHEAQDQYRKAAQIYVKLASQEPDQAREYLEKAAEMRRSAERKAKADDT